ncbi:helix-turn-helix domain-containing protein [Streptomyces sp. NBC_01264]|uniref:helix-turn-helix domain-containing protein n=1 Tax=Streptomyces sp. NBC_01264 TaxID=2903804 RepID=UPI002257CE58|nr:helix-turn-helix domain-containing protein [Streptomyces sp. NBC_01264]MCX4780012.1 helix-turn-helix domain-containing protein [Streptomyces sp. NBC_01264]
MTVKADALPRLYSPSDIAKALGMSEWWVKEQARKRRIPFTQPGRAYRFTGEQFAEILHLFEARPSANARVQQTSTHTPAVRGATVPKPVRQDPAPQRLRARPPRRIAMPPDQQQNAA